LNILIAMAGSGERFKDVGYNLPKPLINVYGRPMIERVLDGLGFPGKYIFIVQQQHINNYHIDQTLIDLVPDCEIVASEGLTKGQACSLLLASDFIDTDEPLLIVNCDNYFDWDIDSVLKMASSQNCDGMIFTFEDDSNNKGWSYAEVSADGVVLRTAEKQIISNIALAGAFYWKHGKDFVKYANDMIDKGITTNGEYYVSPIFNEAIQDGKLITNYNILDMVSMSIDTPDDLNNFETWLSVKKMSSRVDSFVGSANYNKDDKAMNSRRLQNALDELREGKPIVLVDEYDRENEGDLVISAEKASVENLVFTMNHARGLMCMPVMGELLDNLKVPPMVENNTDKQETPFSVSVDASPAHGTTTGMSVHDKLTTIQVVLDKDSQPDDLTRPGHLFPLRARDGLLSERRGHTEGSVQLMKMAGLRPAAIICEIMNTDGTMTKGGDLDKFAVKHGLTILSIEEVYEATYNESV
jgi:3,4-dihydroxy-2-butanone 4-phosphate synthase